MIDYKMIKCFNEVVCKNSGQESVIINKNNLMSALAVGTLKDPEEISKLLY